MIHSSPSWVCISKGNKIRLLMSYLHSRVHCSVIHNRQDMQTTLVSVNGWMDKRRRGTFVPVLSCFSHGWLFVTLWTVSCQAPPSLRFSRQEYWSGLHALLQGLFPTQGLNPCVTSHIGRQVLYHKHHVYILNGILLRHEKERNPAVCNNIGRTSGHHAKWNVRQRKTNTLWPHLHEGSRKAELIERVEW